jgi:hypothetical protein
MLLQAVPLLLLVYCQLHRLLLLLLPVRLLQPALLPGALLRSPPRLTGQQCLADSAGAHLHGEAHLSK